MKSISDSLQKNRTHIFQKFEGSEKATAIVVIAAFLVGSWLPARIIVATSASLQKRVFFLIPNIKNVKTGDYVVFKHQDGHIRKGLSKNNDHIIKVIGCSPGEALSKNKNNQFFCNRVLLGTTLGKDSKGHQLPQFDYSGPVPENSYFMMGTNPRSYDSKYFGFIHGDEFLYKAIPIW